MIRFGRVARLSPGRIPSRQRVRVAWAAGLLGMIVVTFFTLGGRDGALADTPQPLTVDAVTVAFRAAGLPVGDLRRQPLGGSPSSPPVTEREAWAFTIPQIAPGGGRLLVFDNNDQLNKKAVWFRRSGSTIIVHRNIILWLDPALDPNVSARYRVALEGVR